jgi:hypothetical protein
MATLTVKAAGGDFLLTQLQSAINAAALGDTIVIDAGSVITGNFTLPVKTGTSTLTITTSGTLPAYRVGPSHAAQMAKITSSTVDPVFKTDASSHNYALVGLEITTTNTFLNTLVLFGDGSSAQNSLSLVPEFFTIDRCYLHGHPSGGNKRGIGLNSKAATISNCYISEIRILGTETQAIGGWNGPGPYTIHNNYLEAAGENIMFGGADTWITNLTPSNITITNNYFFKPLSWVGGGWSVKNLLELKHAQDVLISGNIFENNWLDAQTGFAILFTLRNQSNTNPWATIKNVTFEYNIIKNSTNGFSILGLDDINPSVEMETLLIQHNLLYDIDERMANVSEGTGITFNHNTGIGMIGATMLLFVATKVTNLTITNNVFKYQDYGFLADGDGQGTSAFENATIGYTFTKNVLVGGIGTYPANNFFPATMNDVGFVDHAALNYALLPTSTYHNAASDGTDIGANIAAILAATSTTLTGAPPDTDPRVRPRRKRRGPR